MSMNPTPGGTPASGETPNPAAQPANAKGETPKSFDAWMSEQSQETQDLIDGHLHGLRSSLESERSERKRLEKEVKKVVKGTDDSNPLKGQLEKISADLSEQTFRADFFEEGHKKGISNLRLAWHAARFENLVDERGRVDWDELKAKVPEVFSSPPQQPRTPPGKAGTGAGHGAAGAKSTTASAGINAAIRRAAGRF